MIQPSLFGGTDAYGMPITPPAQRHSETSVAAAEARRDEGIAKVTRPDWQGEALIALRVYAEKNPDGFLAEEFRKHHLDSGGESPHHHNAWGALLRAAATQGIIEATGEYRTTKSEKTHAHPTRVWRLKKQGQ